jgi:DNA ligase D-like protein (predicted 3'-phosphoesterase)
MLPDKLLSNYHKKRDFKRTPEPEGSDEAVSEKAIFVIQKHDARRLHYDFRLEVSGVLKSWAVPKGLSTDPKERRLALQTEDHPVEYAGFEGNIPEGEYGAGTVLIWDSGTYMNLRAQKPGTKPVSMEQAIEEGKIEVWLEGKKIRGGFALIKAGKPGDNRWLAIKMKDTMADDKKDIIKELPDSVISGRSLEDISGKNKKV